MSDFTINLMPDESGYSIITAELIDSVHKVKEKITKQQLIELYDYETITPFYALPTGITEEDDEHCIVNIILIGGLNWKAQIQIDKEDGDYDRQITIIF